MANRFGTTSDMLIQGVEEMGREYHLAIDRKGLYLTTKCYLDTNLADPNRYTGARGGVNARLLALGLDPASLFDSHKHLIKTEILDKSKKVNPLKASKRASKG